MALPAPIPFNRPVNWARLRADEAERVIRERVRDTDNVIIGNHAFDRVNERAEGHLVTTEDVYVMLEEGMVENRPEQVNETEWKVIVVKRMAGMREAGAVTIIASDNGLLFIKTVQWMDVLR